MIPRLPREGTILRKQIDDPEFFVRYWWNKFLTPMQKEMFQAATTEDHVVVISTRQGGKTEGIALLVLWLLNFGHLFTGTRVVIECYAPTEKQAKEVIFERVRTLIDFGTHDNIKLRDEVLPGKEGIKERGMIVMQNGNIFRIQTASDKSEIRGYSPTHILIDESGSIGNQTYWSDIRGAGKALKGITVDAWDKAKHLTVKEQQEFFASDEGGGVKTRYIEVGTPLGRNHFYDVTMPDSGAYVIMQPWWESPVTNREDVERDKRIMPRRQFEAEYCCKFNVDEQHAFERQHIIDACVLDPNKSRRPRPGKRYYVGVDLGQRKDHTVMSVIECVGPVRRLMFHYRWDLHISWEQMKSEMNEFYQIWKPVMTMMDRTGRWRRIFFEILEEYDWDMEGYEFSLDSKAVLMMNLQILFEQGNIELFDDDLLMSEFMAVEEKRLPATDKPQYPKPTDTKDDQVYSIALACLAARYSTDQDFSDSKVIYNALYDRDMDGSRERGTALRTPISWQPVESTVVHRQSRMGLGENKPFGPVAKGILPPPRHLR
jgi:hypothetical protein